MNLRFDRSRLMLLGVLSLTSVTAQSALSLTGTRLIFDGQYREVSLEARNLGQEDVLVQAWLSAPQEDADASSAQRLALPFVVTPPLSRLAVGGRQTLRVLYQGAGMAEDRESLLQLYVLEVPQRRDASHQVSIAVRQRLNVFYRPVGLEGDPAHAAERLNWQIIGDGQDGSVLRVSNPTAYHVSLQTLGLDGIPVRDYLLLAPGARFEWPLPMRNGRAAASGRLSFQALTDYGAPRSYCARLQGQAASSARLLDTSFSQETC